jgi:hypothetical protein
MMATVRPWRLAVAVSVLVLTACERASQETPDTTQAPAAASGAPNEMMIMASEFAFEAPDSVPAGMMRVQLMNHGGEMHHVIFARIDSGHTQEELFKELAGDKPFPSWAHVAGGPNTPPPGGTTETTIDLVQGQYVLFCVIPSSDGVPHVAKGMARPLRVTAATAPSAPPPNADVTVSLSDYTFTLSTPITAGKRTLRVDNVAEQPHEIVIVKLAPGKTPQDVATWALKPVGPPPGVPLGGTSFQPKGVTNYVTAEYTPGEYALLCFIPDAKDGKPHVAHGMMKQITVQ